VPKRLLLSRILDQQPCFCSQPSRSIDRFSNSILLILRPSGIEESFSAITWKASIKSKRHHLKSIGRYQRNTMAVITGFILFLAVLAWGLWYFIHVPWDFPHQLPRIPIYVSLIGLWSDMGQDEIYERWLRRPLEKHGAVIIWFAGRWNILVTRPKYLTDMFRNEQLYAKAGSQVKIPWSVIACLVGENVINCHGDVWKLLTGVMKPGMQKRDFDTTPMLLKSRRLVDLFLAKQESSGQSEVGQKHGILVNSYIQKWAIDVMGESFLDYDFQVSPPSFGLCDR
jgi:xanthocillin biosynthesis cytochrome P450 monooxygenase